VVVRVDAELDERSIGNVVKFEEIIVSRSRAVLPSRSQDQIQSEDTALDQILGRFGLQTRLVVLERANSLALYFICITLAALMGLRDQWRSLELRRDIEILFTVVFGAFEKLRIKKLTWTLSDYQRCLEFFSSAQGKQ